MVNSLLGSVLDRQLSLLRALCFLQFLALYNSWRMINVTNKPCYCPRSPYASVVSGFKALLSQLVCCLSTAAVKDETHQCGSKVRCSSTYTFNDCTSPSCVVTGIATSASLTRFAALTPFCCHPCCGACRRALKPTWWQQPLPLRQESVGRS